jgi:hypothetical protein
MMLYFSFLPCLLINKTHINSELGFDHFMEDLNPLVFFSVITDRTSDVEKKLLSGGCRVRPCRATQVQPSD